MNKRGFTLLEIMVVIALIGIIATLAFNSMEELRARTAPRTAAAEFTSALSMARNRALSRGSDVWVIIYPDHNTRGAWFVYEDLRTSFGSSAATSPVSRQYSSFTAANRYPISGEGTGNRLLESGFFTDYARKNVRFSDTATGAWGNPFTGLATAGTQRCTFCTTNNTETPPAVRGAIVFTGDGSALFFDGTGNRVAARAGGLTITGVSTDQPTRIAVSGATGYTAVFQ